MTIHRGTQCMQLDPNLVRPSRWANREEASFSGTDWERFKEEIKSSRGNIQPIKVRRDVLLKNMKSYEIVFGHRRHRACLELGLKVLVLIEQMNDQTLFEQMERENRLRKNLTPWEQGRMYRLALEAGLYPSLRKLVESIGCSLGNASIYIKLARLPESILNAFESRLDIQQRWIGPLSNALEKNPDHAISIANQIEGERRDGSKVTSMEAFARIIAVCEASTTSSRRIKLHGGAYMQVTFGKKIKLEFDSIDGRTADLLLNVIVDAMRRWNNGIKTSSMSGDVYLMAAGAEK